MIEQTVQAMAIGVQRHSLPTMDFDTLIKTMLLQSCKLRQPIC